jgi:hypothetical protein
MPQNTRKVHIVCRRCKTRFSGAYCPYCGAEKGAPKALRSRGGLLGGLLRFLFSLLALALILIVTFVALDYSASAAGGHHGAARAILDSARYAIPKSVLDLYAQAKTMFLDHWIAEITEFFTILFS